MTIEELDAIAAQLDSTVPYYLPQLVREFRAALVQQAAGGAQPSSPLSREFNFSAHLQRQREFSERTFGPGRRTKGVIQHIRKELKEIASDPSNISEWIDVVILALDGAWRAGHSPDQIIAALQGKQAKNEARTWPDWRTMSPDQAIEHTRNAAEEWPCSFSHHQHTTREEAVECARPRRAASGGAQSSKRDEPLVRRLREVHAEIMADGPDSEHWPCSILFEAAANALSHGAPAAAGGAQPLERQHTCGVCGWETDDIDALIAHVDTHGGAQPSAAPSMENCAKCGERWVSNGRPERLYCFECAEEMIEGDPDRAASREIQALREALTDCGLGHNANIASVQRRLRVDAATAMRLLSIREAAALLSSPANSSTNSNSSEAAS